MGSWIATAMWSKAERTATHRHVPPRSLPISTASEEMPELGVGELVNQPVTDIPEYYNVKKDGSSIACACLDDCTVATTSALCSLSDHRGSTSM